MFYLKRRWQNFSTGSRILVLLAIFSVVALASLIIFLQNQMETGSLLPGQAKTSTSPTAAPTPVSFQYPVGPQATPAPPPKNEPERLLVLADRYLADGEAVDAAAQYRLIIDSYPKSPEVVAATFGLAQASATRQRWQEATQLYQDFLKKYPDDSRRRLAYFGLAETQKAQGFWDGAINYYQKYLQEKDGKLLEGYVYFDLAEALNSSLKKEQAIEYYKKAGNSPNGSNLLRVTAFEKVADYYAGTDAGTAAVWYNKVLEIAKIPDYRAGILLKMAKAYASSKQLDQANTIYNVVVDQYLETPSGLPALKALSAANPYATSDFHRGYAAFQAGDWDEAISAFSRVLGRSDEKALPNTTPPLAANLAKAEQEKLAKAWFWLGRAYELKGDPGRAANEYRELQIRLPQTGPAQEGLWRIALILRNAGQADAAAAQFALVASTYPAGSYAEQALYNQADIVQIRNGPEAALPLVNAFADKFPASELRNAALFDLYRAFEAKGNKEAARAVLQKAATSSNADYYALRANEIISGQNPMTIARSNPLTHPATYDPVRFGKDVERDQQTMESWLLSWAAAGQPQGTGQAQGIAPTTGKGTAGSAGNAVDVARQNILNDAGLKRLAELRLIGQSDEAEREAKEAIDRYAGKPIELYLLALYLNEQGQYYYSLEAAHDVLSLYEAKKPGAGLRATPLMLQKLIYPLDYQNLVLEQSRKNDLDPLLFLALMKQESAFRSDATSSVGARGLTQVMPDTGRGIASNLDKPGYNPDDLYHPATAIEFGAYYLSRRLEDFQGNPYAALAAYNGGAGNVYRWLEANPPEKGFDNFVEGIDFAETRGYVKIIYTSYAMYRQIYGAGNS